MTIKSLPWSVPTLLLAMLLGLAPLGAFPTPSAAQRSWELDFTHARPRAVAVKDLDGKTHWFWYLTYKVVNNTGEDRLFVPEIAIATSQGHIVAAGRGVPSTVFHAIKERLGNRLLETPTAVVGKLRQGDDLARESVAIWPAFPPEVTRISVFVAGLSGETQVVKDPQTGQDVLVAKTLMLDFDLPGEPASAGEQPVLEAGRAWVMR